MLSLILMDPFDLQIIDAVVKKIYALSLFYEGRDALLCSRLDLLKFFQSFRIVPKCLQILQPCGIQLVIIPYFGTDPVG